MVRSAPDPPRVILASGTRSVLEEVALTTRLAAGVSASPTVKASSAVGMFLVVAWSVIFEMVGRLLTVRVKLVEVVAVPSETLMVMVAVPVWLAAGVMVTVGLAPEPPKEIPVVGTRGVLLDVAESVSEPAAVSTSPMVKAIAGVAVFTLIIWLEMAVMVGASLTAVTARVNVRLVTAAFPSVTEMVIAALPLRLAAGVILTLRLAPEPPKEIPVVGTRVVLEDEPLTVKLAAGVSTSPMVKSIVMGVSSLVVLSSIADIVGESLTGVTVKLKVRVVLPMLASATTREIVAVPLWLAAGRMVTERLLPDPPKLILVSGTSAVLEDEPLTVRLSPAVSVSDAVKLIVIGVSSPVVWSSMAEITGTAFTVRVKVTSA